MNSFATDDQLTGPECAPHAAKTLQRAVDGKAVTVEATAVEAGAKPPMQFDNRESTKVAR